MKAPPLTKMVPTMKVLLPVALALVACGTPEQPSPPPQGAASVAPDRQQANELGRPRATLGGWATQGFCTELGDVLGAKGTDAEGRSGLPGTAACFESYGVDGVGFWGDVRAGYLAGAGSPVAEQVNGRPVGVWNVSLRGASAERLFNAMVRTWSGSLSDDERQSRGGRIHCTRSSPGQGYCQLSGLIGVELPALYF